MGGVAFGCFNKIRDQVGLNCVIESVKARIEKAKASLAKAKQQLGSKAVSVEPEVKRKREDMSASEREKLDSWLQDVKNKRYY